MSFLFNQKIQDQEREIDKLKEEIQSLKNYRSSLELLNQEVVTPPFALS